MADLAPTRAFPAPVEAPLPSAGVQVRERQGVGLATILIRRSQTEALATKLGVAATSPASAGEEKLSPLPQSGGGAPAGGGGEAMPPSGAPHLIQTPTLTLIPLGPATWLALTDHPAPDFAASLSAQLAPAASVSDQSSAYALLHLTGPATPALLAKGVFLDLDRFAPGHAAATQIAHMSILLWRDDTGYTLACFRSYAGSLWHWLTTNAAEFGLAHSD